jgi:BON domain-containing protein
MLQRWQRVVAAAFIIGAALGCGRGQGPALTAPVKTTPAKPEGSAAKPPSQAAQPEAKTVKPGSQPSPGMIPGEITSHRPPAPPPSTRHTGLEVPQAKSLAATPDMVLNSRVRASLMSALTARSTQDIEPQTVNGVVTLTGTVKTPALRARAEQVARGVHGVRAVTNHLMVK